MANKTYVPEGEKLEPAASQIGATIEALAATIASRRDAGDESYTHRLLAASPDAVLKKVMEEAGEVALAAKDVESWATSSIAAALAGAAGGEQSALVGLAEGDLRADETGKGAPRADGSQAGDSSQDSLRVELPAEYFAAIDHLRYEAADVVYHLLVVLERYGISTDEFAAELNERMTEAERPQGAIRLEKSHIQRGK